MHMTVYKPSPAYLNLQNAFHALWALHTLAAV